VEAASLAGVSAAALPGRGPGPPGSSSLGDSRPAALGHPAGMSAVVVDVRDVTLDPGDLGTERGIE
jgi:hypothetical protein